MGGNAEAFNNGRGKGYLYRFDPSTQDWVQAATVDGQSDQDGLGDSSSVSADCSLVAYGTHPDNGPGYVQVYRVE